MQDDENLQFDSGSQVELKKKKGKGKLDEEMDAKYSKKVDGNGQQYQGGEPKESTLHDSFGGSNAVPSGIGIEVEPASRSGDVSTWANQTDLRRSKRKDKSKAKEGGSSSNVASSSGSGSDVGWARLPPAALPSNSSPSPSQSINIAAYARSPLHSAIAARDHTAVRRILAGLPRPPPSERIKTEQQSLAAEVQADVAARMLDRRDVAGKESPLCLAVRMGDAEVVDLLMEAGADSSLQNAAGWTPLQEAVCAHQFDVAALILRHSQVQSWHRYQRRLPALAAILSRMADFYMELTWAFESPVLPFISRIAPSDTYRVWKKGAQVRADITLAGFDGLRVKRRPQSILFLGLSGADGRVPPSRLVVLHHGKKEASDALELAAHVPSDSEIASELKRMVKMGLYKAGIDMAGAELSQVLTWRGAPRTEVVSGYKTGLYEMQGVAFRMKSRRVVGPDGDRDGRKGEGKKGEEARKGKQAAESKGSSQGAKECEDGSDDGGGDDEEDGEDEDEDMQEKKDMEGVLTEDERKQLKEAMDSGRVNADQAEEQGEGDKDERKISRNTRQEEGSKRRGWFGLGKGGGGSSRDVRDSEGSTSSREEAKQQVNEDGTANIEADKKDGGREVTSSEAEETREGENEFRRGLKPLLWLTRDFPLEMKELMPLLDLLANRVKAVKRLKELLMLKLPPGMVPVKVAIPVIPTVRVQVTFSEFRQVPKAPAASVADENIEYQEALEGDEAGVDEGEDFHTPTGSPERGEGNEGGEGHTSSWLDWMRRKGGGKENRGISNNDGEGSISGRLKGGVGGGEASGEDIWAENPFLIPAEYTWVDVKEKKRREKEKKRQQKLAEKKAKEGGKVGNV